MTDLTPNDLSHLSDAEFQSLCPQGEHAPGPEPLSPAAQAVMDAYWQAPLSNKASVAAVIRAAAMQTLLTSEQHEGSTPNDYELGWNAAVAYIQTIATELENHQ